MSLTAHVAVASRSVDATISVGAGRSLALVGPNGSGKSTILEALAGLVTPTGGSATVDHAPLFDADGPRPIRVAPSRRGVGIVPQDGSLFPHLTVLANTAYPLRSAGWRRSDAEARAAETLDSVGIGDLARRKPDALSGGQARRAAIARALAGSPSLLLLDEPFAGLDVGAASGIREIVAGLRGTVTMVLATHDAADALLLADEVAVMDHGTVVETGPCREVFLRPRTPFAARLGGRALLTGAMVGGALVTEDGMTVPVASGPRDGARAALAIRPADVAVGVSGACMHAPGDAAPDGRRWIAREVTMVEPREQTVRIHAGTLVAEIDPADAVGLTRGQTISFGLPADAEAYEL